MELKLRKRRVNTSLKERSNRTFMELKSDEHNDINRPCRSNRTFMELKFLGILRILVTLELF